MIRFNLFARSAFAFAAAAATLASAAPSFAQAADGLDRRVLIDNRSGQTILYVRGSPVADESFGPDRIPDRTLGHGASAIVDFDSGTGDCMYDLRVTLTNGRNIDRMNVNVCRVSRWTINRRSNDLR
jgi:hypothetical protein